MGVLPYDSIWLGSSRLMTPRSKPLWPVWIDRGNEVAEGLTHFAGPWDSSGVAKDVVTGQLGRHGLTNSVRYANGNVVAAYVQYGLNRKGTSNADSYANALVTLPDIVNSGFSYAARIHFRKDYTTVSNTGDYAFRLSGTNVGTSYHCHASGAAPNAVPLHRFDTDTSLGSPVGIGPGVSCDIGVIAIGTVVVYLQRYYDSLYPARSTGSCGGNETGIYVYAVTDAASTQPEIEYIATWDRAMPETMMWDFLRNPYQVLIPI